MFFYFNVLRSIAFVKKNLMPHNVELKMKLRYTFWNYENTRNLPEQILIDAYDEKNRY